jgi:hypothetical protein
MHRRRFIGTVSTGIVLGVAGCVGGDSGGDSEDGTTEGTELRSGTARAAPTPQTPADPAPNASVATRSAQTGSLRDVDLPLPKSAFNRGAPEDAIPAITSPVFGADWSGVDATLGDDDRVIGVAVDGNARAYPLPILNWHEVVNDDFGGPLLVTFCPLCGSGVTAERRVDGQETVFGVSGLLWQNDLVMDDELTGSVWSQVLGTAVRGPQTGESLTLRPSTITTWSEWHTAHPETGVLLPPPESGTIVDARPRNYDSNPYSGYENNRQVGVRGREGYDRLHPKTQVIGIATDDAARAYPLTAVEDAGGIVTDTVGDRPVVVAIADESLVAYDRRVDGQTLEFDRNGDVLTAGGSRWNPVSGRAMSGPHEGTTLARANDRSQMFWFAWLDFFPETDLYGQSE